MPAVTAAAAVAAVAPREHQHVGRHRPGVDRRRGSRPATSEKKNGLQNRPHSMVLHTKASSESTLAGPPGPPVAFDVTSDALALSWDAPANTGGRAVRGYQVPLSRLSSRTNFSPHYHP